MHVHIFRRSGGGNALCWADYLSVLSNIRNIYILNLGCYFPGTCTMHLEPNPNFMFGGILRRLWQMLSGASGWTSPCNSPGCVTCIDHFIIQMFQNCSFAYTAQKLLAWNVHTLITLCLVYLQQWYDPDMSIIGTKSCVVSIIKTYFRYCIYPGNNWRVQWQREILYLATSFDTQRYF